MASTKGEITRAQKQRDTADDQFQERGRAWVNWLEKNFLFVAGGLALIVLGVVLIEFLGSRGDRSDSVVTADLVAAVDAYEGATDIRIVLTSTSSAQLEEGYTNAKKKFDAFLADHPDHDGVRVATVYRADLDRRLKRYEDAEKGFRTYVEDAKPDDILLPFALEGLGYTLESQNKNDEALQIFTRIAEGATYYKDYGLKHKARVLEKKGDKEGAIAAYQAIVDMEPASELRSYAEGRIKTLK